MAESELVKSATDLIIQAMEKADEMEEVIVVYRVKGYKSGDQDGFGWVSNSEDSFVRIGMLESAKWGILRACYPGDDE
jgi:hypothetical protein